MCPFFVFCPCEDEDECGGDSCEDNGGDGDGDDDADDAVDAVDSNDTDDADDANGPPP